MSLILDGTNGLSDVDGSAAIPALRGSDANTGIFFPAADQVAITTGGTQRVITDASGNVGLGATPSSWDSTFKVIEGPFGDSVAYLVSGASLQMASNAYYNGGWKYKGTGIFARYILDATGTQPFVWFTAASGSADGAVTQTQAMTLDSSGNLLVGQTALNGAGKVEISYDRASSWGMQIRNTTGTTQATTYIAFKYGSTQTGYIESSGTNTTYNTSSDYRLKEDIAPMTGALAKVVALKPVTYKWKSTGMVDEGFIAHELAEVCPSAVTGTKDAVDADGNPQYQGIDTSFLVATLTAAIQEQQALITQLQADVAALKAQ